MSRIIYVNGQYVPYRQAYTHIEDRGYQFSDGVYEVIAVMNSKFVDLDWHIDRLEYSLAEIRMKLPCPRSAICIILEQVIFKNRLQKGMIYLQVTRGIAPRAFPFPKKASPSLVVTAQAFDHQGFSHIHRDGVKAITVPDLRWKRPDIKSISLLASVQAKQQAYDAGAYEAIFMTEDNYLTEGSSSNLWIVNRDGILQTHPVNQKILAGITRQRLISLCEQKGITVLEKPFTLAEFYEAQEAFFSASNSCIIPLVSVNDKDIGVGRVGPFTRQVQDMYFQFAQGE